MAKTLPMPPLVCSDEAGDARGGGTLGTGTCGGWRKSASVGLEGSAGPSCGE